VHPFTASAVSAAAVNAADPAGVSTSASNLAGQRDRNTEDHLMAGEYRPAAPGFSTRQAGSRMRRNLRRGGVLPGLAAAAVLVAACGSSGGGSTDHSASGSGSAQSAAAANGGISTRTLSGIGTVLVDRSGMTIYTPKQQAQGLACTGACLSFWFPVTGSASALSAASDLPGKLGTVHRADNGGTQLTYNGKPLYTFRLDTSAGQDHGNNYTDRFGGTSFTWEAVTASGQAAGAGSPAPTPTSTGYSSGSGSGY
jgi:predicted lipoprotein with Yx(FWY)xxD motif